MAWGNSWSTVEEKTTIIYSGENNLKFNHVSLRVDGPNLKPTHDPYTNPNSNLYYECSCGAILDPGTKSFAALNNCASENGWKVRFGHNGYVPYCVKCGESVE